MLGRVTMVRFFHVARSFPGANVLTDVHLTVERGELALVSGGVGAGKTTLARLLLGLDFPQRGWITVDGVVLGGSSARLLAVHRRRIAALPQTAPLVSDWSVLDNVALALEVAGAGRRGALRRAALALERTGRAHFAQRAVRTLSRGERQWVAIARALVRGDAGLLIADEPADGLDGAEALLVGGLLAEERAAGKTVVVFSRSSALPGARPTRRFSLADGQVVQIAEGATAVARRRAS
jgi:ABC-type ATPase involved in cell division